MSRSHAGHQCRNQTSLSRMGCMLHAVRMWFLSRWTHMRELTEKHRGPLPKTNPSILTRSPRSSSITNTSILTHSPAQPVLLRFVCVCVCVCGGGESLKLKCLLVNVKAHDSIQCKMKLGRICILEASENKWGCGNEAPWATAKRCMSQETW